MRMRSQWGATLIEIIVCLAIFMTASVMVAPMLSDMINRSKATVVINWLVTSIIYTRYAAIQHQTTVTLCPSDDGRSCGGSWSNRLIAFTDTDSDRTLDSGDHVIKQFVYPVDGGEIQWRSFRNRQYLQMVSTGYTNFQNGNFVYCPSNKDARFARQLVLNAQGRLRSSKDVDHDGYVEDRRGRHLSC